MPAARFAKPSAERSRTMRAVKSRDTKPELLVAALLEDLGVAYRREVADLPGKPDFIIEKRGRQPLALFVHGCWWHAHDCPRGARTPKTNRAYWLAKITRNRRRDRRVTGELRALGYSVWTIWECRLKSRRLPPRLITRLKEYTPPNVANGANEPSALAAGSPTNDAPPRTRPQRCRTPTKPPSTSTNSSRSKTSSPPAAKRSKSSKGEKSW